MELLKTQGFILIDVDVAALNNAGVTSSSRTDNVVETKKIRKNGRTYVYVSGQAWRYWWRETLKSELGWKMSPVQRDAKIAYTAADPLIYPDDDIFGYMKAAKGSKKSFTRVSPLKNSAIVSVASVTPVNNMSTMTRGEGDPVPYGKEEYSAVMKGMFSLDLFWAGAFAAYDRPGFMHLSEELVEKAKELGAEEVEYPLEYTQGYKPITVYRLPKDQRIQRITDTIKALKYINGGAMQTSNKADVSPKFIILATTRHGNHPFSHIAKSTGEWDTVALLDVKALEEALEDNKDSFVGKVFIGKRAGFMDDLNEDLEALKNKFDFVEVTTVNKAIDGYVEQLKDQIN